jgi:hypothetical protein
MTTTRFPNGITTVSKTHPLGIYESPDPAKWHQYFDDFNSYFPAEWTVDLVGAGGTRDAISEDRGILSITNSAGDDDHTLFFRGTETFLLEINKKTIFKARFSVSDATQSDFSIGLRTSVGTVTDITDGIYFSKSDGSTALNFSLEKDNNSTTASSISTIVNNTYLEVAFVYNGRDKVSYYVNNKELGYLEVTNLPDDEELAVSFGIQNGEAVAKTMKLDYLFSSKER